jgi:hypothetical protein
MKMDFSVAKKHQNKINKHRWLSPTQYRLVADLFRRTPAGSDLVLDPLLVFTFQIFER